MKKRLDTILKRVCARCAIDILDMYWKEMPLLELPEMKEKCDCCNSTKYCFTIDKFAKNGDKK